MGRLQTTTLRETMMEDQVVEMMQAIQTMTPEVAAQAVAYGRWINGVWALVGLIGAVIASVMCIWLWKRGTGYWIGPFVCACFVLVLAMVITVSTIGNLVGSYIAPDYYAADAVIKMVRGGP
jgi:hypothetical protein